MRAWIGLLMLSSMSLAQAMDIGEVLSRSQQGRLASLPVVQGGLESSPLKVDFDRMLAAIGPSVDGATLHVVEAGTVAETIEGRVVVLHSAIARWTEAERLFVIAHELGHVAQGHWGQLAGLYQRHIPGAVTPETTSGPVAALLGREAAGTSHRHELEADAFALRAMESFGYGVEDVLGMFRRLGSVGDTATHPGVRKRIAHLRALSADRSAALQP